LAGSEHPDQNFIDLFTFVSLRSLKMPDASEAQQLRTNMNLPLMSYTFQQIQMNVAIFY